MEEKKRLVYIDCIRGLCILLVIYHHFLLMGMRDTGYNSSVGKYMYFFFLPLFFFISGFLVWKKTCSWNAREVLYHLVKKTRCLLIPTILMFSICMLYFHLNCKDWLFVSFKSGYWFTWSLFQMFTCWFLFNFTLDFLKIGSKRNIMVLSLFFLTILGHVVSRLFNESNPVVGFLSLNLTLKFFVYFMFGIIVKMHFDSFEKILSNKIFSSILFIVSLVPLFAKTPSVVQFLIVFAQISCIFKIFHQKQNLFNGKNIPSSFLANCGKYSLSIYFLHYFLLFKIPEISSWLQHFQADYCFRGPSCVSLLEFVILFSLSIFIAICCIIIKKIIDIFPTLSELCFGPNN